MPKTLAPLDGSSDAPCATGRKPLDIPFKVRPLLHGVGAPCGAEGKAVAQGLMGSARHEASHRMSQGHIGQEWLPAGGAAASPVSAVSLNRRVRADEAAQGLDA